MKDYKALSRATFDKQAAIYDVTHTLTVSRLPVRSYPFMLEELRKVAPASLLDVGCGTGTVLALLAKELPGMKLTGLDLSPRMLEQAKAKRIPRADFLEGDGERLPFPDGSFACVTCMHTFHHFPRPEAGMAEMCRVLEPGGTFLLCDGTMVRPLRWLYNRLLLPHWPTGDFHVYDRAEMTALCRNAGLTDVEWRTLVGVTYLCKGVKPRAPGSRS